MARPSSVRQLPPELRDLIARLRGDKGCTIDQIREKLLELDAPVSRSALGRYVQEIDAAAEEIQRTRAMAEAITARYGEGDESRLARANIEMMHGLLFRLQFNEGGRVEMDAKEAMFLASALKSLTGAAKDDQAVVERLRKTIQAEHVAAIQKIEAEEARRGGGKADPEATLKRVRELYGLYS
ncbi:MAG: phage protein Gp27 family protein [Ferrovibrionaceae bacterium]